MGTHQLYFEYPPVGYGNDGKLKFAEKPAIAPESYILWDASRDAPPGFGLKVAKGKTYILRRKVMGKSMLSKVGNFNDFEHIQVARAKVAELARAMVPVPTLRILTRRRNGTCCGNG